MEKYKIKVKGTTPLIINVRKRELDKEMKELKRNQLDEWEEENWKRKAETDSKGKVILPTRWFRSSFINACRFSRLIPHFATSKKETYTRYAESMLFQDTTFKEGINKLKPFGAYVGARGKNSPTKVWKIRPQIDAWETEFEVIDPFGRMNEKELQELLEYSGMLVGVGDARNLNFGRFKVISIKNTK
jgi:hypothetical protein